MGWRVASPSLDDRRTLVLLVTPIVVIIAVGTVANALTPLLLKQHPLVLIAGEARNRNLLLAASRVSVVPFVLVGVARRMVSDPLFFALGHLYGDRAVAWIESRLGGGSLLSRVTTEGFRRFSGLMVFLFPGSLVCVLAGASGMRVRTFLALNLAGTVAAVLVLRAFAAVLKGPVGAVQRFNDRYVVLLTVLSVVAVAGWLVWQRWQGDEAPEGDG
jgi:membrane-associated protein